MFEGIIGMKNMHSTEIDYVSKDNVESNVHENANIHKNI